MDRNMRNSLVRQAFAGAWVAVVLCLSLPMMSGADEAIELADYMSRLQYFSHKMGLSIYAKNKPLARFYLNELEEIITKLKVVKVYEGHSISALVQQFLVPAVEKVEASVETQQFPRAQLDYEAMLDACNSCHKATAHGYIKIEKRLENPFMQSFEP